MREIHTLSGNELFKFLSENKNHLIAQKKFEMKKADAFSYIVHSINDKGSVEKLEPQTNSIIESDKIHAKLVINTTNILDSHGDVHIDGIWKKSLKEHKDFYLLQEHRMNFDHVISDSVKAYTEHVLWEDLGFSYKDKTQALVFDTIIEKGRNEFMFNQYLKGYVTNHSVGMWYVKLFLCINDSDYKEEKSNWDTYIDRVVNRNDAEEKGYFWAVTEAKIEEGSAVLKGSNHATPTLMIEETKEVEPPSTQHIIEPLENTHKGIFETIGSKI